MQNRAYDYLIRNRLHHIDMLEAIDRGMAKILYAEADGVLLYNIPGETYMMSTESRETFEKMCDLIENPLLISPHQSIFAVELQERFHLNKKRIDCFQYAYLSRSPLPARPPEGISFRPLNQGDADFVFEHYQNAPHKQHIADRISDGMLGAFQGEVIAGFIGTHPEGSMGLLEVMPDFRRRGIARGLQAAMTNFQLSRGEIPYCQVETKNDASRHLQASMNFEFSDKTVIWII